LAINNLHTQLGICEGSVNEANQPTLHQLVQLMIEDFNSRWGASCRYNRHVVRADRNRQIGIATYAYWATALDPRTKKKPTKCLTLHDANRVWEDITNAALQLKELHDAIGIDNNNNNEHPLQQHEQPQPHEHNQIRPQLDRTTNFYMTQMMRKTLKREKYHWINKLQKK
jgi:hypothetical protein